MFITLSVTQLSVYINTAMAAAILYHMSLIYANTLQWRAHRIHLNLLRVSPRPSALFCLPSGLLTQNFKYIHTPNDIHSLLNISDLF